MGSVGNHLMERPRGMGSAGNHLMELAMYCCAMNMRYRSFVIACTCVLRVPGARVWPRVIPA